VEQAKAAALAIAVAEKARVDKQAADARAVKAAAD